MRRTLVLALLALAAPTLCAQEKPRLPRPQRLDAGVELRRDAATGELRYARRAPAAPAPGAEKEGEASAATIRVGVNLVEVACTVLAPDGTHVRGLAREDFRVFEDDAEQAIAHFDAASDPARIVLVLDASPSVLHELDQMKQAARALAAQLSPADEVAVVAFAARTYLLLPFSRDRVLLERAIDTVEVLRDELGRKGSNIYEAVYFTAQELFARGDPRPGRKAILLLTDGQDSGLGLGWDRASALTRLSRDQARGAGAAARELAFEDVAHTLAAAGVEVYAVSTQNRPAAMTEAWLTSRRGEMLVTPQARELGMPHYTLYLAEVVRRAGGQLFFLREIGTLSDVYRRIAENLRAQYTLGYYPAVGSSRPGWRALRAEVKGSSDARIIYRPAYYVPVRP